MNRISFQYDIPDDLPDAVRAYTPSPALTHRNYVPASDVRKLIRDGAPRAEIEKLCRFGGHAPSK